MKFSIKILFTIILLSAPIASQAKTLYVNVANGNDSVSYSENSSSSPWRTFGRAVWGSTSISSQNSSQAAQAGDTVLVAAGTYNTNAATDSRYLPLYNPVNSGTSNAPITFRAVGTVNLQSSNSSGAQPIAGTFNRSNIIWDGFTIDERYVPTRRDTGPVVIWSSQNVTLTNMKVYGVVQNWGDNHNGIRIEDSSDIVVRNNTVSGFNEDHGGCITTYTTSRLLIEHNDITDTEDGIFIKGANGGPVTIRYNKISDAKNSIMFGGIGLSGEMSYVYQNVIVNSFLGGVIFIGYDNITPAHVMVANNTIYNAAPSSDGGGILLRPNYSGYQNINFVNNIVTSSAAGVTAWGTDIGASSFSHNNYYGNNRVAWIGYQDYTMSAWQDVFGKDTNGSSVSDPRYLNAGRGDFRLSSDSPLRNAGRDILDLDGDGSTSDSINMGAYLTGNEVIGVTTDQPTARLSTPEGFQVTSN